ncbi:hypothetical protein ARMGADRAFT_1080509 [Armillaria gallica]|uniref:Uncharacterized protein n=1 Tax=Armillaria gallica TaxID=47427 RepID=A0A2H3DF57_ARMGA|nr:hypothetical protein ARMGADRAFT_1080509 [Armillaria gallica]
MANKNTKPPTSPSKATSAKREADTPPPSAPTEPKRIKPNIPVSPSNSVSGIILAVCNKEGQASNDNAPASDTMLSDGHKSDSTNHDLQTKSFSSSTGPAAPSDNEHMTSKTDNITSKDNGNVNQPNSLQNQVEENIKERRQGRSPTPVINPNMNSFFNSFMKKMPLMMLPRVKELGISYGDPTPYPITPFVLADHVGSNEIKAERILKYALAAEGTNLYNLFSIQPRNFRYIVVNKSNDGRKIVRASDNKDASFYMVGRVTHCSLENGEYNKEIDIQPLSRLLPRCVAAIAQILRFQQPVFSVYKDGLTISSYRKPMEGQKEPKIKPVPMNGETHGPSIRAWNHEVPMFSGRSKFALTHYPTLPPADIKFGDYALVVFTIGGYRSREDVERVSLNVQFAIELETHADKDTQAPFDSFFEDFGDETPLGVDDTRVMEEYSGDITDIPISVLPSGPIM